MFKAIVGDIIRSYDFNEKMHDNCADYIEGEVIEVEDETIVAVMTSRIFDGKDVIEIFTDKVFKTAQNGAMMMDDSFGPRIFKV